MGNQDPIFARRAFRFASLWGAAALIPLFFLKERIGREQPPAITHPEYFYGFMGVALVWQLAFYLISTDPRRLRPMMPAAIAAKLTFAAVTAVLFAAGLLAAPVFVSGMIDLAFGLLFVAAYAKTEAV